MPRPNPDQARLITDVDLKKIAASPGAQKIVNDAMKSNRTTVMPLMVPSLGKPGALKIVRLYEHQLVRVLFGKGRIAEFDAGVSGGAIDQTKLETIHNNWLEMVIEQNPQLTPIFREKNIIAAATVATGAHSLGEVHYVTSHTLINNVW